MTLRNNILLILDHFEQFYTLIAFSESKKGCEKTVKLPLNNIQKMFAFLTSLSSISCATVNHYYWFMPHLIDLEEHFMEGISFEQ